MLATFYGAGIVAIIATLLTITRRNAIHALLYLIISLLAIAIDFYIMGAPFVAALELIIYAGAIMVLFVFVVMMLNIGEHAADTEGEWLRPKSWLGPGILCAILLVEFIWLLPMKTTTPTPPGIVSAKKVGIALFGPYAIAVELASLLLTAGLVGAYHLGRRIASKEDQIRDIDTAGTRSAARGSVVCSGTGRTTHAA